MATKPPAARSAVLDDDDDEEIVAVVAAVRRADKKLVDELARVAKRIDELNITMMAIISF